MDINDATQEQLDALEAKVGELDKVKGESDAKQAEFDTAKAEWEKEKAVLTESANPNWAKARQTIDALKEVAKSKGVELNEDGTVKSNPGNVDVSAITKQAVEAARGEILGNRLEEILEQYDSESAKVVKHYYQKLTQGEGITMQNIEKFVRQAERAAELDSDKPLKRATTFSGGQGPKYKEAGSVDSSRVEGLAKTLKINIGETK